MNPYADDHDIPTVIRPNGGQSGIKAVYNHQTKAVDVIHYPDLESMDPETLKRRQEEDAKRKSLQGKLDEQKRRKEEELAEARKLVARNNAEKRTEAHRPSLSVQPKNPAQKMASLNREPPLRNKMEWDNAYALARYKNSSPEKFEAELDQAGFTEDEKTLVMLKMQMLTMQRGRAAFTDGEGHAGAEDAEEKHVKFVGRGHSLVQNDDRKEEVVEDLDMQEVVVDSSLPVTSIRVSLPGQQPIVGHFNLVHTVQGFIFYLFYSLYLKEKKNRCSSFCQSHCDRSCFGKDVSPCHAYPSPETTG